MNTLELEIQEARAQDVRVEEQILVVKLADGRTIITPLAWYPRLMHATPQERANFEIIGEDRYIHWPDLDEDLSVAGILVGRPARESAASLKKWLAARPQAVKQALPQVAEKKARYAK
ncbi:MAG: DUF2442 domain-containing protein [Anaerolineales bacterium]